jgi:hypothetical protein
VSSGPASARHPGRAAAALPGLAVVIVIALALGVPGLAQPVAQAAGAQGGGATAGTLPGISQRDSATTAQGATTCVTASTAQPTGQPWDQAYLDPEAAWELTEGAGVTVAVLGSGVDDASGMLAHRLTLGPQEVPGAGSTGIDCVGQGTFAAGLIAAEPRAVGGFAGIAPEADILAIGVTDDSGATDADLLAEGIRAAADEGARVIDVTATAATTDAALNAAVSHALAKGALIVAPYLADGQTTAAPAYPAALPGVLSVADLAPGGSLPADAPTPTTADGNGNGNGNGNESTTPSVDLTAPGDDVDGIGPGGPGMFVASGPSYAAALVAGTAALVLSYRPQLTEPQLMSRLEETAYHPGTTMPDPQLGYGTVDPVNAVSEELPQANPTLAPRQPQNQQLTMPQPIESHATRDALAVTAASALVILLVSLCAAATAARRRKPAPSPSLEP